MLARNMSWLGRTACLLALWCLLEGVLVGSGQSTNRTEWRGSTNSTTRFGEIGDNVDSFKVLGEEVLLETPQYQRHKISKRGLSQNERELEKKLMKLEVTVNELKIKVKFLNALYDKDIQKKFKEIEKTTKKNITDLQNSLRKCCGSKPKPPDRPYRPDRRLSITADDEVYVYVDGKEITLLYNKEWNVPDTVVVPKDAKVIAVKGVNLYADTGIIASTPDGWIRTNSSWKCINKKYKDWEGRDFDDSAWSPASIIKSHMEKPIIGIREDAYWIWTDSPSFKDGDRTVFCRYTLQKPK